MFEKAWSLISQNQFNEAQQELSSLDLRDDYSKNFRTLLRAEIALRQGNPTESIQIASEVHAYWGNHPYSLKNLEEDRSGIGLNCLETCFLYLLYTRALIAQSRWQEAWHAGHVALREWQEYKDCRFPFINTAASQQWAIFPSVIESGLEVVRKNLGKKPSRKKILDLLVPDGFEPSNFKPKTNGLRDANPFVSVCLAAYKEGPWLKDTLDAIFANAGYDHFEVVIIYQKEQPEDAIDPCLEEGPYFNHPKIKLFVFDRPLGCDAAKEKSCEYASGELLISLDAHVILCKDYMAKTVKVFWENPEVCILAFGIIYLDESHRIGSVFFNHIPWDLYAIFCHHVVRDEGLVYYRPGLYRRPNLPGATFCIMKHVLQEVGGYLTRDFIYSCGDSCLGMSAYLYGYYIYTTKDLVSMHKSHQEGERNLWRDTHRKTKHFEYENDFPASILLIGYFYFSQQYFEQYFVPWIQVICGEQFSFHWEKFQKKLPPYIPLKQAFWAKAVRSVREFWFEFWDHIWPHLSEHQKQALVHNMDPESPELFPYLNVASHVAK